MADPYRAASNHSLEPDDMSSFLHNLLHSSADAAVDGGGGMFPTAAAAPDLDFAGRVRDSSPDLNFSDHSAFYGAQVKAGDFNAFGIRDFNANDSSKRIEFVCDNKGCETSGEPSNRAQPRSAKRSRSAEVHNLSEKRRRSRINEKLKALQTLIPNSNKTDKASMLDEAIDYLKQLQLQVQMLTMRNGMNLYPGYCQGSLQSVPLPQSGVEFENRNTMLNPKGAAAFSGNQEMLAQTGFEISNQTTPSMLNNTTMDSSVLNQYGLLNQLPSSKDLCRDEALSRLHLETSCSGNNSSPGISS